MINQVGYTLQTADGAVRIIITPTNAPLPGGDFYSTGVFKLSNGVVGMGEIVFDDDMSDWNYDGMDELTYEEAEEIADFIKRYRDPEGADPSLLS